MFSKTVVHSERSWTAAPPSASRSHFRAAPSLPIVGKQRTNVKRFRLMVFLAFITRIHIQMRCMRLPYSGVTAKNEQQNATFRNNGSRLCRLTRTLRELANTVAVDERREVHCGWLLREATHRSATTMPALSLTRHDGNPLVRGRR